MLALLGDGIPNEEVTKTLFHADRVSRIPVTLFYIQLSSNAGIQDEQAILVLILIERFCSLNQNVVNPVVVNSKSLFR